MPSKLDGIAAVEAFKELGEEVGTMRSKEKMTLIKYSQPGARFLESRVKEILFKKAHEHVGIGGSYSHAAIMGLIPARLVIFNFSLELDFGGMVW
jgi:hypothetical protein